MEDVLYKYWFMRNEDVSYYKKPKLIEYFYNSYNLYCATKGDLMESRLLDEGTVDGFIKNRDRFDMQEEYEKFINSPFSFVTIEDKEYPDRLKNIYDKPYGLYYVGKLPVFEGCFSIVGARICSAYGKRIASELGKRLGENGFNVISGMARGIDSYGHKGCLEAGGTTVAVLGSGCDVIYPRENRLLYEEIISKNGAIISEYQMGTSPVALNFPRRNRIVSALSDAVIVVEAKEKSGSLITADFALEHGRDIYVAPGRIGDSLSLGCNRLISQGAGIIYDIDAFIDAMLEQYGRGIAPVAVKPKEAIKLSDEQRKVFSLFDDYPKSISTIIEETNMDYLRLISVIFSLERYGLIAEVFKNNYTRV